jgi:hypothetical protein
VTALLAVAAVSSAFGWPARVLDVIAGEPAPPRVRDAFALESEARERVLPIFRSGGIDVVLAQAHGVVAIESSEGPVILWVAPTPSGGACWLLEYRRTAELGLKGCSPGPVRGGAALAAGVSQTRIGDDLLQLIDGRVGKEVASVEVLYADGESETIAPVEGFLLHEPRERPTALVARDAAGAEIARREIRPPTFARPPLRPGPERVVIRFATAAGHPLTFALARAENGDLCEVTRYRGSVSTGCTDDRRASLAPDELSIHPGLWNEAGDGKPLVTLRGVVGSAIARLELEYANGETMRVPVSEQFVLFEIPPAHHADERFVLVGRNAAGAVIARRVVK